MRSRRRGLWRLSGIRILWAHRTGSGISVKRWNISTPGRVWCFGPANRSWTGMSLPVRAIYKGGNELKSEDLPSPSGRGREARARQGEASRNGEGPGLGESCDPHPARQPAAVAPPSPRGRGIAPSALATLYVLLISSIHVRFRYSQ